MSRTIVAGRIWALAVIGRGVAVQSEPENPEAVMNVNLSTVAVQLAD